MRTCQYAQETVSRPLNPRRALGLSPFGGTIHASAAPLNSAVVRADPNAMSNELEGFLRDVGDGTRNQA